MSTTSKPAAPRLGLIPQIICVLSAIASWTVPAIWIARLQSWLRLKVVRVIHHRPGQPLRRTYRFAWVRFKTVAIAWYNLNGSAVGLRQELARRGVATWVWSNDTAGTFYFKVRADQQAWAEYIMLAGGRLPEPPWHPRTVRAWPGIQRRWAQGRGMPQPWAQRLTRSGTWEEWLWLLLLPPQYHLLELPSALRHLVEFRTEHVQHTRRRAGQKESTHA